MSASCCAGQAERLAVPDVVERHAERTEAQMEATSFREARETGEADLTFAYVPADGFAYRDERGELTGVTIELLRDFAMYVAREHDIEVRVTWREEPAWTSFYDDVRDSSGGVFGVGNVTITEERREELAFSPPYMVNVAALITHEDVPALPALEDIGDHFRDLTALAFSGTLHEERLEAIRARYMPAMRTRDAGSNQEILDRVGAGPEYFAYVDLYNYARARDDGAPLRRHEVGDDDAESFGVILPRGSDWEPIMGDFFEEGYAEGERFRAILGRHLGEELAARLSP